MNNLFDNNSIYIVLIISMIVWIGISFILLRIDRKISKLEKRLESE